MRVLGVIPARGGSKGIPKKNIVDICGKPLIAYSIDAASKSQALTTCIVSTDSDEIADVATRYGALAQFRRPAEISNDTASSFDVIMHALEYMEAESNSVYDAVMLLQPTTPMRTAATIDAAIRQLSNSDCDSVVSVVDVGANHPYRMYKLDDKNTLVDLLANDDPMMPRQRLPKVYIRSGDIYVTRRECLMQKRSLIGGTSKAIVIKPEDTVNIDTVEDLIIARHRISERERLC